MLLVGAGADTSIKDVEQGYLKAFSRILEHSAEDPKVWYYNLDARISMSGGYLMHTWKSGKKKALKAGREPLARPTYADIMYHAASGSLERALRPDVPWVVIVSGMYLHPDWVVLHKRAGRKVCILYTESPYDDEWQAETARHADLCFTNERSSVPVLRAVNPHTYYLPHAMDPARHRPDGPTPEGAPAHDVVFVGTGFIERIRTLEAVDWTGIDFGLYGTWPLVGPRHRLRQWMRGGKKPNEAGNVHNESVAALYRRAAIGLNLHRTSKGYGEDAEQITHAESVNPRAIELAACGAFMISDYRAEGAELFGDLVPTFRTPQELTELLRYYLAHPEEREAKRRALPACVAGRTFENNARMVLRHLSEHQGTAM
jgi:spore maturation protein CgeB